MTGYRTKRQAAADSYDDYLVGLIRRADTAEAKVKRLTEELAASKASIEATTVPGFKDFVEAARLFLTQYPSDVVTASSGDPGPVFVVAIREAVAKLEAAMMQGVG